MTDNLKAQAMTAIDRDQTLNLERPTDVPAELAAMERLKRLRGAPRCTAKAKGTGERCQGPAVKGWRVCRVHGARGGAPKGSANSRYRHGLRTREAIEERRLLSQLMKQAKDLCDEL
jgi:hypothetical protein